uniref:DUF6647 family protein n=1 Tax=Roseovarius sp. BRH_c41 TaxID=1629709 RepID=UPI000B28274D|nr:DUF6647 family protein [Roseovarius sp. BRH_c41]
MKILCKGPAVLALCVAVAGSATAASPRDAPSVLDTLMLWLATNFDLAVSTKPPVLITVPDAELVEMRYGVETVLRPGDVVALYDHPARTIYLSDSWTGNTPADLSVLVHEMVHHLQAVGDMRFACPAEREVVAYRAQEAWLGLFGESLETSFGISAATILVGTVCTH